jgi:DNA gyrase subunit A
MADNDIPPTTPPPAHEEGIGKIEHVSLTDEMQKSYLDYAMSVIVSRALPDVRDGLKPVQRRIIFAMNQVGYHHSGRFQKCASVTGEVMKNYHPHGNIPIYDALVRMAQDFTMRYQLIDPQGNFGSVDGDPPAAERYTECRLSAIADELLRDINKNTVDFVENYSGTTKEPIVLPSMIPNLLLNGASGIAVGMATQIPPHNLGEVTDALIYMIENPAKEKESKVVKTPDSSDSSATSLQDDVLPAEIPSTHPGFRSEATVEDLMKFIKGPDFPTGASIYDATEILAAYATGKGRVVMRAKADIEETRSGRFDIIVTELPYQVNKAVLIAKIADLVKDKKIDGIADLRDESDRKGMRIVVELKRDAKPQSVLNNLFKHTALQSVFNVNMVALSDGVPHLMTLKRILEEFIHHRQVVVKRRSEFELNQAKAREHILEGLKIAVDNIDEVISTIRRSADQEEAKENLMKKFKLSEIQATAILDMQLRRLAALERKRIEEELKLVRELIAYLEDLLANPLKMLKVIKEELNKIRDKYADDRKTRVYKQKVGEFSEEDLVADETTIVTVTEGGYIKRQAPSTFRTQNRGGKGVSGMTTKEEDAVSHIFYTKTLDNLLFFTDKGRVFQIKVWEIPEASRTAKGQAIVNLINVEQGEKITAMLTNRAKDPVKFLFMCTKLGNVKKTQIEEYANIRKNGLISIKLDAGDKLCWVVPTKGADDVILVSRQGQSIRFSESQVRPTHRDTSGVRGIMLKKEDEVVSMNLIADPTAQVLVVMQNGLGKKTPLSAWKRQGRGGSGIIAANVTDKTGVVVTAQIVGKDDDTLVLTSNKGQLIKLNLKDVPTLQRQTQGVILMRMRQGELVAAATVVSSKEKSADAEATLENVVTKTSANVEPKK